MTYLGKKLIGAVAGGCLCLLLGCSSSSEPENLQENVRNYEGTSSVLSDVIDSPDVYINRDLTLQGVVQSVSMRKVNKDISLLMLKLTPVESSHLLLKPDAQMKKFLFIQKLRQAEDLFTNIDPARLAIPRNKQEAIEKMGCDLKIAANRLQAISHYYEGQGMNAVASSYRTVSNGFRRVGAAYFSFKEAASLSHISEGGDYDLAAMPNVNKFEKALFNGGQLFLEFASGMEDGQKVINEGTYSYDANKALNPNRPFEILTFSSMLNAEAWKRQKEDDKKSKEMVTVLSKGVRELGEGDKLINKGLRSLAVALDKTAIKTQSQKAPALKCAYYGFNGSHLNRCAKALRAVGHSPVIIKGSLVLSNLREEVDVLWLQAEKLEVDGMVLSFSYGEENGTLKGAVDLYNWAEGVKKEGE